MNKRLKKFVINSSNKQGGIFLKKKLFFFFKKKKKKKIKKKKKKKKKGGKISPAFFMEIPPLNPYNRSSLMFPQKIKNEPKINRT